MPLRLSFDLYPSLAHVGLALVSPYVGRKKAFLIGIEDGGQLQGSHDDIQAFRTLLIEKGFDPENIIMMLDDGVALEPTRANIMEVLKTWLVGQCAGDIFVFVYAGHATQEPCLDGTERDNLDELLVTSDNERIKDDDLHDYLVRPLRPSSTLVAFFDSCHSQDILDLSHDRCNRLGHFRRSLRSLREMAGWRVPARRSCHGYCPRIDNGAQHPNVICISACKDSQQVFEAKGNSMLHAVIGHLRKYDQTYPTLKTLMRELKETAGRHYREAKRNRKTELKSILIKWKYKCGGKGCARHEEAHARESEAGPEDNICETIKGLNSPVGRWAPQLSSTVPLWLDRPLKL